MSDKPAVSATTRNDADFAKLQRLYQAVYNKQALPLDFAQAVEEIDWQRKPAEMFADVIRLALMIEALGVVRHLAKLGAERFPDDEYLVRAWKMFGPPRVVTSHAPPRKGQAATMAWLQNHAHEYRGSWIAVQEGQLIADASSFNELIKKIGGLKPESNILTGYIP
jgi:hypothetical protein